MDFTINNPSLNTSANVIQQTKKKPMHPTPLEYSCWITHSTVITKGVVILLMILSTIIGVIIVYLVGSKVTIRDCQLKFTKTKQNALDYNSDPRSVAIGDFNNDSWPDFVVANRAVNNISVFLGSTDGTFSRPTTYSTGSYSQPEKIAVADLNNDQRLDLVIAYFGTNSIGVYLGKGNGTFVNYTTVSTNTTRPKWIHIAHLDNDTFVDLVTADYGTDSITLFSGDGTGNFSYRMRHRTGFDSSPVSVTSGDLNNDHHLDLVVANSGTDNIGIFFGRGDGEFSEQRILWTGLHSRPNSIAIGHLDNDELLDIASANYGTHNIGIFRNLGNGSFGEQKTYELENASPYFIDVADMNKDQRSDLIVTGIGTNNIGILLRRTNGGFSKPLIFASGSISSIFAAVDDLNNDNLPDIIAISSDTNIISICLSKSDGFQSKTRYSVNQTVGNRDAIERVGRQSFSEDCKSSSTSFITTYGTSSVAVADLNDDGYPDMAAATVKESKLLIFVGDGNGSFTYESTYRINTFTFNLKIADFNADTHSDIVVAYGYDNDVRINILLGCGNGSFIDRITREANNRLNSIPIAVGDLNNDSRLDVVAVSKNGEYIFIFLGYGNGSLNSPMIYPTDTYTDSIVVSDFNSDTILDIALTYSFNGSIGILLGYGNGSFGNPLVHSILVNPNSIVVDDFNADGIPDVVVTHQFDSNVIILLGLGNGSFQDPSNLTSIEEGQTHVSVGDFNADDKRDIVVALYRSENSIISLYLGYGNGSFQKHISRSAGKAPRFAAVADLNDDDRSDIILPYYAESFMEVFIYSQISFTMKEMASGLGSDSRLKHIMTDDFNKDNILDMVVINDGNKNIALLFGQGDGSFNKQSVTLLDRISNSRSMAIADFNHDNHLDVAVANSGTSNIDMLLGDGTGRLIRQDTDGYRLDHPPSILVADDFNQDGYSEIAVAYDNSDDIDIFITYNPANFTHYEIKQSYSFVKTLTMGDFNEDGIIDIVIPADNLIDLRIMFGHGDGSFAVDVMYPIGVELNFIAAGHFNNDTHWDIAVAKQNNRNIDILFGYGNASFVKQNPYSTNYKPRLILAKDLNNDTFSDLIVSFESVDHMQVSLSHGNGSFTKPQMVRMPSFPMLLLADNVDNDEFIDIIVQDSYGAVNVLFGYGNGSFNAPISILNKWNLHSVAVGHLNNDTWLDVVFTEDKNVTILLGFGNGSFTEYKKIPVGCRLSSVAIADLNNDIYLDLVVRDTRSAAITVLLGDSNSSFASMTTYDVPLSFNSLVLADLNNDARLDIITYEEIEPSIGISLQEANHVFKRHSTLRTGLRSPPQALATGHFNNDTHPDILFLGSNSNSLGVFLGLANGSFSPPILSLTDSSPSLIAVGQLNTDAHLDVVIVYSNRSSIAIHLGNGNGSFIICRTYSIGDHTQPKSVSVADFDNDDFSDIIILDYDASNVLVFIGYGNGNFATAREISIGYGSHPFLMSVGDYNNDHKLDLAVGNYDANNLEMYLQTCY